MRFRARTAGARSRGPMRGGVFEAPSPGHEERWPRTHHSRSYTPLGISIPSIPISPARTRATSDSMVTSSCAYSKRRLRRRSNASRTRRSANSWPIRRSRVWAQNPRSRREPIASVPTGASMTRPRRPVSHAISSPSRTNAVASRASSRRTSPSSRARAMESIASPLRSRQTGSRLGSARLARSRGSDVLVQLRRNRLLRRRPPSR